MKNKLKTMKKIGILLIFLMILGISSFGQNGAKSTAQGHAEIVAPITITKVTDINFGKLAVHATNGGTVVVTPASGTGRSATGGVTFSTANTGTVGAAEFTVGGQGNYTYHLGLPSASLSLVGTPSGTMTADTWTSSLGVSGNGTLSSGGSQTIYVGATLNVTGGQTPGVYSSTVPFEVTVDYN